MTTPDFRHRMTDDEVWQFLEEHLLSLPHETEWVEFKTASRKFNFDKLGQYVSALSNEAHLRRREWAWLVFGVNDDHQVVGTEYKRGDSKGLNQLKKDIGSNVSYGTAFHEIYDFPAKIDGKKGGTQELRVVLFQIPAATRGRPKAWKTVCYGREGDSIGPLSHDKHELFVGPRDETVTPVADGAMLLRTDDAHALAKGWRKVAPPGNDQDSHVSWLGRHGTTALPSLAQSGRRVLLYGPAGAGKTFELRRVARHSASNDELETCFIAIESYVSEPIARLLPQGMLRKMDKSWLIFLDGFDQLQQGDRLDFVRQVESFGDAHPEATIVLSSRTSFVDIETEASCSTLKNFSFFEILDLDHDAIMALLDGILGKDRERFLECLPRQVGDLLVNASYLHHLAALFQREGGLFQNKAVIFRGLLDERWRGDAHHFRTSLLDFADYRQQANTILERLAVAMETLCRNWISHEEYLQLVPEHADRRLLQHCGVWEKQIGKDSVRWQFQHNGFQEYLAAKRMELLPLDTIKEFVAFGPDHEMIIPSWANVVGFMLDNTTRQDVFDWVLSVDPAIAVQADQSRIGFKKRNEIFHDVYGNAKAKKVLIDRDRYPIRDLARFADHRENVRFLLNEAENPTSKAHLGNSIYLLRYMHLPYSEEERAKALLLGVALDEQQDETIRALALFALSNQKLDDPPTVKRVVDRLRDSKRDWMRYSLYSFLHNSDQLDKHVDVFIEGIPFIRSRVGTRGESRLMNEGTELNKGINKTQCPSAIKRVFAYFTENPSDLDEIRVKAEQDGLIANAARAYEADQTVYYEVLKCFAALMAQYIEKEAAMLVTFFERTGTRSRAFEEVLATWKDVTTKEQALVLLAERETLKLLIHRCKEGDVGKDILRSVRNLLRNTDQTDADWFQEALVQEFGEEFEMPPPKDFDQEERRERQRSVDLLFDREAFLKHARSVLDCVEKDEIACNDISDLRYRHSHEHDHPHLVMEELTRLTVKKAMPKGTILDLIDRWNWERFRISTLHGLMSGGQEEMLTNQQAQEVEKWCVAHLGKVDFRTAIEVEGTRTSYKWLAIYLWFFFRKLDLDYPKDTLLDMISFDYFEPEDFKGIEYLEQHLHPREMRNRVLDNLAAGIAADHVLKNHLNYCHRHEEMDGVPFARTIVSDASLDDSTRRVALDVLVALAPEELGSVVTNAPDAFKWNVVDAMVKSEDFSCRDHLMALAQEAEGDERDNAICYLVRMGDLDGLQLYVDRTRELGVLVKKPWILDSNPLASFRDAAVLPLFLELLELSYTIDQEEDDVFGNTLYRVVQDALAALALLSDRNHAAVHASVAQFVETHSDLKNVHFLHAFLEKLETQFYRHKTEKLSVSDVIMKLERAAI